MAPGRDYHPHVVAPPEVNINTNKPEIRHDGTVVKITGDKYVVKITSRAACGGCPAKSLCTAGDMTEKYIETISGQTLEIGDEVTVIMAEKLGLKAIFYSFFLPFLVMVLVLVVLLTTGSSETIAALTAIGSLFPYYLILYRLRKNIGKDFIFRAEPRETRDY